jgi:8-oxo-dGTP diphosphatase
VQEPFTIVPYALGYLVKDNSILLLYRHNTPFFNNYYSMPGGKIERDESPSQALVRELGEELGIGITGKTPLAHVMYFEGVTRPCVVFVFLVGEWSGEPYNKEPEKHSHISWFPLDQLPKDLIPRHGRIIAHIGQSVWYAEEFVKE